MDLKKYPHHLIDIVEPDTSYSVSHFRKDVESIYKNAEVMNRTPFLTGGTMMYFHSLEFPLDDIPPTTPKIRLKVEKEFLQLGLPSMYEKLVKFDSIAAKSIHATDKQRILRAIEVCYESG